MYDGAFFAVIQEDCFGKKCLAMTEAGHLQIGTNLRNGINNVRHAHEIGFYFYKIERRVMPECFYRASIVSEKMDARQKHAGMTMIDA
ncbi:hypothetical protein JW964_01065 [candidate division KSB1 bacterium]|nr:hypothetical protein [candidate division KSB1 bacterium]